MLIDPTPMTTSGIEKKIKALVDEKRDMKSLKRVYDQLNDPALEAASQAALIKRLDRAEEDFKAGRVTDVANGRKRLRASLKKGRATQTKRA